MPELPEVETTRIGLKPYLEGKNIKEVIIRQHKLRWPIPFDLKHKSARRKIKQLSRRGKYLLIHLSKRTLIIHLGMSGSLRILTQDVPPKPHDHVDFELSDHKILRFTDPRRFGLILWTDDDPLEHALLKNLGVEPLSKNLTAQYFLQKAVNKHLAIKSFIMNSKIVVGIGNIYATEALYFAGIHPLTPVNLMPKEQWQRLVVAIKKILKSSIKQGGTTLKDFVSSEGKPGYFKQHLKAYGRAGLPCIHCQTPLKSILIGQRTTVYCEFCQQNCR